MKIQHQKPEAKAMLSVHKIKYFNNANNILNRFIIIPLSVE